MGREKSLAKRLWENVLKAAPGECWPWMGYITSDPNDPEYEGYGRIWYKGQPIGTQVAVWLVTHGSIPEGKVVLTCPLLKDCCNPEHIGLGDKQDVGDRILWVKDLERKTPRPGRTGVLTDEQVREIFLAKPEPYLNTTLGRRYNRSPELISRIRNRQKYRAVTDALRRDEEDVRCRTNNRRTDHVV